MKRFVVLLVVTLLAVAAWAQPDPNTPPANGGDQQAARDAMRNQISFMMAKNMAARPFTALKATPAGLFVIRNGAVAKYDAHTLKPIGQPIDLFDPMPAVPVQNGDQAVLRAYADAQMKRLAPMAIAVDGANLVIASADQLFCINTDKMVLKGKVLLNWKEQPVDPQAAPGGGNRFNNFQQQQPAPTLEVANNVAYLNRDAQLLLVDLTAGTQQSVDALPELMVPGILNVDLQFQNGGRGGGGAGGAGRGVGGAAGAGAGRVGGNHGNRAGNQNPVDAPAVQ